MGTSNLMTLEIVCSDYGSRIVKKKKFYFAIFALHIVLLLVAIRTPGNFQRVSICGNTFTNQLIKTKVLKNTRHVLKLTYDSAIIRECRPTYCQSNIITQQTGHAKKVNSRQSRLHCGNHWKTGNELEGNRDFKSGVYLM